MTASVCSAWSRALAAAAEARTDSQLAAAIAQMRGPVEALGRISNATKTSEQWRDAIEVLERVRNRLRIDGWAAR